MSATACAGALGFTAKRLQAQADFLQSLAGCNDLPELLKRQSTPAAAGVPMPVSFRRFARRARLRNVAKSS